MARQLKAAGELRSAKLQQGQQPSRASQSEGRRLTPSRPRRPRNPQTPPHSCGQRSAAAEPASAANQHQHRLNKGARPRAAGRPSVRGRPASERRPHRRGAQALRARAQHRKRAPHKGEGPATHSESPYSRAPRLRLRGASSSCAAAERDAVMNGGRRAGTHRGAAAAEKTAAARQAALHARYDCSCRWPRQRAAQLLAGGAEFGDVPARTQGAPPPLPPPAQAAEQRRRATSAGRVWVQRRLELGAVGSSMLPATDAAGTGHRPKGPAFLHPPRSGPPRWAHPLLALRPTLKAEASRSSGAAERAWSPAE